MLLRHAKSAREPGVEDHERDLTERGEADAGRIGALIAEQGLLPDLVLVSTAVRALRTADLALGSARPRRLALRTLYLAGARKVLEVIAGQGAEVGRLLVVGHNPDLEDAARHLAGSGDKRALGALAAKFPTAALALIRFDAPGWRGLEAGSGRLAGFWRPRQLG